MRTSAILAAVLVCLTACGGSSDAGDSREELTGVIVKLDAKTLGKVEGFTLRREGRNFKIVVDHSSDFSFPPDHLREHMVTAQPVRVEVEKRGGKLYAVAIEDA